MPLNDKEPLDKIFCLFHQKVECSCIHPVTENKTLIERLQHFLRLYKILNKHESNGAKKEERNRQSIIFENRLSDLKD